MKPLICAALALLALAPGCASEGYRQEPAGYSSSISDVPPSFYGSDPALSHWYTAPYWNPDVGK